MPIDTKSLTIDSKQLLKMSVTDRVNMANSSLGQQMLSSLTPTQYAMLFPSFYRRQMEMSAQQGRGTRALSGGVPSSESLTGGPMSGGGGRTSPQQGGSRRTALPVPKREKAEPAWYKKLEDKFGDQPTTITGGINREKFRKELAENPKLAARFASLAYAETGSQGKVAQQAWMETVFNRATARGVSLETIIDPKSKYWPAGQKRPNLSKEQMADYQATMDSVLAGSNISNYATDNASNAPGNPVAANRQDRKGMWINGEWFYTDHHYVKAMEKLRKETEEAAKKKEEAEALVAAQEKAKKDPTAVIPADPSQTGSMEFTPTTPDKPKPALAVPPLPEGMNSAFMEHYNSLPTDAHREKFRKALHRSIESKQFSVESINKEAETYRAQQQTGFSGKPGESIPSMTGKFTSAMGDPRSGGARSHQGNDLTMPHGSDIRAMGDGVVIKSEIQGGSLNAGYGGTSGGIVTVRYTNGVIAKYLHTSDQFGEKGPSVKPGQIVKPGDLIGKSGTAANVPHVHYELYQSAPMTVDELKKSVEKGKVLGLQDTHSGNRLDPAEYHGWKRGQNVNIPSGAFVPYTQTATTAQATQPQQIPPQEPAPPVPVAQRSIVAGHPDKKVAPAAPLTGLTPASNPNPGPATPNPPPTSVPVAPTATQTATPTPPPSATPQTPTQSENAKSPSIGETETGKPIPKMKAGGEVQAQREDLAVVNTATGEPQLMFNSTENFEVDKGRLKVTPEHRTDPDKLVEQKQKDQPEQKAETQTPIPQKTGPQPAQVGKSNWSETQSTANIFQTESFRRATAQSRFLETGNQVLGGHFSRGNSTVKA